MRLLILIVGLLLTSSAHAQQTGSIRGWVGDDSWALPLPGIVATVTLAGRDGPVATATTDASGVFVVERLEPGAYEVRLEQRGLHPARLRVGVGANMAARVVTLLEILDMTDWVGRGPMVRGTVLDPAGKPVAGAFVRAMSVAALDQEDPYAKSVTTDARGRFELPAQQLDIYLLIAIAPGHLGTVVSHPTAGPRADERGPVVVHLKSLRQP